MSTDIILSIETSCDETAIAVLRSSKNGLEVLTNQVSSQVKLHAKWGGVMPNLAAREHVKNFPKLLEMALSEAQIEPSHIDLIATTNGPGLIPALMVGVNYAKTLSYLWEKPIIGIHHIEGHIYANFINQKQEVQFPVLALVVSGGHTQLMHMKNHLEYEIIGQTVDDAVGEAFDKVARILEIGYPGGPRIAEWSKKFKTSKFQISFPRPMLNKKNFNFSFSGLKTAVLYETKKHPELLHPVKSSKAGAKQFNRVKDKNYISEVCHEFQQACIDVLVTKTIKAAEQYKPKTILLAGGVSANKELREQLGQAIERSLPPTAYQIPPFELTGDNAAMVASAASFRWKKMSEAQKKKAFDGWKTIQPDANLKLK